MRRDMRCPVCGRVNPNPPSQPVTRDTTVPPVGPTFNPPAAAPMPRPTAVRRTKLDSTTKGLISNAGIYGRQWTSWIIRYLNALRVLYFMDRVLRHNHFQHQRYVGKSCPFSLTCQANFSLDMLRHRNVDTVIGALFQGPPVRRPRRVQLPLPQATWCGLGRGGARVLCVSMHPVHARAPDHAEADGRASG